MPPKKRAKSSVSRKPIHVGRLNIDLYALIASHLNVPWLKAFSVASKETRRACLPFMFRTLNIHGIADANNLYGEMAILPFYVLLWRTAAASDLAIYKLLTRMPHLHELTLDLHSDVYPCSEYLSGLFEAVRQHVPRARVSIKFSAFSWQATSALTPFDCLTSSSTAPAIGKSNSLKWIWTVLQRNLVYIDKLSFESCHLTSQQAHQHTFLLGLKQLTVDGESLRSLRGVVDWIGGASLEALEIRHLEHHLDVAIALSMSHAATSRSLTIRSSSRLAISEGTNGASLGLPNLESLTMDTLTAYAVLRDAVLPRLRNLSIEDNKPGVSLPEIIPFIPLAELPVLASVRIAATVDNDGPGSFMEKEQIDRYQIFQENCRDRNICLTVKVQLATAAEQRTFSHIWQSLSDKADELNLHINPEKGRSCWAAETVVMVRLGSLVLKWSEGNQTKSAWYRIRDLDFRGPLRSIFPAIHTLTLAGGGLWTLHLEEIGDILAAKRCVCPNFRAIEGRIVLHQQDRTQTFEQRQKVVRRFRQRFHKKGIDTSDLVILDGMVLEDRKEAWYKTAESSNASEKLFKELPL